MKKCALAGNARLVDTRPICVFFDIQIIKESKLYKIYRKVNVLFEDSSFKDARDLT